MSKEFVSVEEIEKIVNEHCRKIIDKDKVMLTYGNVSEAVHSLCLKSHEAICKQKDEEIAELKSICKDLSEELKDLREQLKDALGGE